MIDFHRPLFSEKEAYQALLAADRPRGCEYSFNNIYMWGQRQLAFDRGFALILSRFDDFITYSLPVGTGDRKAAVERLLEDAGERGIPFRLSGLNNEDRQELEALFPGKFRFQPDRDSFDYVYDINALAELPGRKLQKKRNHVNRFYAVHPDWYVQEIREDMMPMLREMAGEWYAQREAYRPEGMYNMEKAAISRAFDHYRDMDMEGLVLKEGEQLLAFTIGSRLREDMFDTHFEKAVEYSDGTYAMINREFAVYMREKYPELRYINREDDMGLEGLRQAKCAYNPHHLIEKQIAYLPEEGLPGEEGYGN